MAKHKKISVKKQISNFDLRTKRLKTTGKKMSADLSKAIIYCRVSDQQQVTY